jgi:hypothetical protein
MNKPTNRQPSHRSGQSTQPIAMLRALEPRIMFDAAIGATAIDVAHTEPPVPDAPEPALVEVAPAAPATATPSRWPAAPRWM